MEKTTIRFRVSGQNLTMVGNHHRFASNSVGLVRIEIDPEDEWIQFDSVDAIFQNDQDKTTMTMFYEGASYTCTVPADMLSRMAKVYVNLSGKNIVDGELVERLTTYPVLAFIIDETSNVSNYRDSVVPANQYEQFIEAVGRQASKLADVEVTAHQSEEPEVIKTYTPNYPLSLDFGLVKGDKGDQGDQGIQGIQGETGDAAGFGTVSATVDANHGTPAVTVTASGDDTAKNFAFAFSNLQPAPYDDSVIQARMDTFTNLAAGSTTGDAELADGRVGADGVTYTNIGGAIRGQVTDLKSDLNFDEKKANSVITTGKNMVDPSDPDVIDDGYINTSGVYVSYAGLHQSGFIPVEVGENYTTLPTTYSVLWYNANKELIGNTSSSDFNLAGYVTAPNNSAFARFIVDSTNYSTWMVERGKYHTTYEPVEYILRESDQLMYSTYKGTGTVVSPEGIFDDFPLAVISDSDTATKVCQCSTNQWDEESRVGNYDTSTGNYNSAGTNLCNKSPIRVNGSTSYYLKTPSGIVGIAFYYDSNYDFISYATISGSFTTPASARYMNFYVSGSYGQTYNNDIAINYPSTITTYQANQFVKTNMANGVASIQFDYDRPFIFADYGDITYGTDNFMPVKSAEESENIWDYLSQDDKKLKLIAGAIRNDGNGWAFISDANHNPINLSSISVITVNSLKCLNINYGFTAKKVISLIVCPDETFANQYRIGGSVGLSSAYFQISQLPKSYGGMVILSGNSVTKSYSNFTSASFNTSTGEIKLNHPNISSAGITEIFNVTAMTNSADYRVIYGSQGNDYVSLYLVDSNGDILKDNTGGEVRIGVNRYVNEHFVDADTISNASGNFWIFGVMEVN